MQRLKVLGVFLLAVGCTTGAGGNDDGSGGGSGGVLGAGGSVSGGHSGVGGEGISASGGYARFHRRRSRRKQRLFHGGPARDRRSGRRG